MIQIKLNLVNLIQRREPTTHRWMVKRRFNYNNNVATLGPANFIVIYPLAALTLLSPRGNKIFSRVSDGIYPAASLVVVEVHHLASVVKSPWNLIGFSLADINEVLSKSRVITNVIISHFAISPTHLYPYSMLSPQPPQIQADLRSLGLLAPEQPQLASWPSLQPRDTECTTPALATAWAKAASLEAETETESGRGY